MEGIMNYPKITAAIFLIGITYSFTQSSETKEKLKNLKGEVTKITVETTEGKVELTGKDAETVFAKLKSSKNKSFVFVHTDNDDDLCKEITVDVDINDNNGEKVIIIKKKVDGKETVEEYKGKAAEKYLKEHGDEHKLTFISEDGDVHVMMNGDEDDLVWVSEDDGDMIKKNVNVEVEDGVKKVTITTTKDSKEKVEVYEGEEAEKYLEEMDKGGSAMFIDDDGNKTVIKKKTIIIEEEADDGHDEDNDN